MPGNPVCRIGTPGIQRPPPRAAFPAQPSWRPEIEERPFPAHRRLHIPTTLTHSFKSQGVPNQAIPRPRMALSGDSLVTWVLLAGEVWGIDGAIEFNP